VYVDPTRVEGSLVTRRGRMVHANFVVLACRKARRHDRVSVHTLVAGEAIDVVQRIALTFEFSGCRATARLWERSGV
jgi:hypothetical protein